MRYKTGMYGGSFDPLHIGHLNCIIQAASMCEELFVVLSYSRERDYVPMEIRFRWIYNSFLHMQNVHIVTLEDNYGSKAEYDSSESAWEAGRDYVIEQIGRSVDVVFCGVLGAGAGGAGSFAALYGLGTVGLSGAGIMSGLATAGGGVSTVLGGAVSASVAGVFVLAAPVAAGTAIGVGATSHLKNKKLRQEKERLYKEALQKHNAIINELKKEANASKERLDYLQALNICLSKAIDDLKADLGINK